MNIRCATLTHAGGRSINDDTVCVREKDGGIVVFVGDGLGGYAGGQKASQAAAKAVMDSTHRGSLLTDDRLIETVKSAEEAVKNVQKETGGNMKTTLVTLAIEDGRARWAHVGDSRLYHFRDGSLVRQTLDHSVSQVAVLMGEIEQSQIRHHADRNLVLRALGSENAKPEISPVNMLTGGCDAFLLCTDGMWEYVLEEEMEQTLKNANTPEEWLSSMEKILLSRAKDDHDNYTAAAVFC